MLSLYNSRMNAQLLRCCKTLPSDKLEQNTHTFFPIIISYWNHILFGDLIMLNRLVENETSALRPADLAFFPTPTNTRDIYFVDIQEIEIVRKKLDKLIVEWCSTLSYQDCENTLRYTTTEGVEMSKTTADVVLHMFNHQTHHRGQLTSILSLYGADYGCTDLLVIVPECTEAV